MRIPIALKNIDSKAGKYNRPKHADEIIEFMVFRLEQEYAIYK